MPTHGHREKMASLYTCWISLEAADLAIAESELIQVVNAGDPWPIMWIGHTRSQKALPVLYDLLTKTDKSQKMIAAHAIFQTSGDQRMIELALEDTSKLGNWYEFIDILYMLPDFKDDRVQETLENLCSHPEYLVSYNAKSALSLSKKKVPNKSEPLSN